MTEQENINICNTLISLFKKSILNSEDDKFEYYDSEFIYGYDKFIKYEKETDTLIIDNKDLAILINYLLKEDIERLFTKGLRHSQLSEKNINKVII